MLPASTFHRRFARLALMGSALAVLSACTNGVATTTVTAPDGSTTTLTALTYGVPEGETLPVASYDSTNDTWIVTDGTDTVTLARLSKADMGDFQGYGSPDSTLWMAVSPSGDLLAGFGAVDVTGAGAVGTAVRAPHSVGGYLVRRGDGTLPTGGTASYTGGYAGIIQDQASPRLVAAQISGDAALTADFDAGTVSGAITNRVVSEGNLAADLTLATTSIGSNGIFSGTATGGEIIASSTPTTTTEPDGTTSGGTYDGLFGGDNAGEVAVGIHVDHVFGVNYIETGAFIATQ